MDEQSESVTSYEEKTPRQSGEHRRRASRNGEKCVGQVGLAGRKTPEEANNKMQGLIYKLKSGCFRLCNGRFFFLSINSNSPTSYENMYLSK